MFRESSKSLPYNKSQDDISQEIAIFISQCVLLRALLLMFSAAVAAAITRLVVT
jgi:hypothetical protein